MLFYMNEDIFRLLQVIRPEAGFQESVNFVEDALLDSLDIILLVSEIESRFGIKIPGEKVVPSNFHSVEAIAELISSLR